MNILSWGRAAFTTVFIIVVVTVGGFVWNQQIGIAQAETSVIDAR